MGGHLYSNIFLGRLFYRNILLEKEDFPQNAEYLSHTVGVCLRTTLLVFIIEYGHKESEVKPVSDRFPRLVIADATQGVMADSSVVVNHTLMTDA